MPEVQLSLGLMRLSVRSVHLAGHEDRGHEFSFFAGFALRNCVYTEYRISGNMFDGIMVYCLCMSHFRMRACIIMRRIFVKRKSVFIGRFAVMCLFFKRLSFFVFFGTLFV